MAGWTAKRFWENAEVTEIEAGFSVLLDGRKLRTPVKSELVVPTREMAGEIAREWQAQGEKVDPLSMPFTRSANAAIDKVGPMHAEVAELVAEYGGTDLICYRAASPKELIARQSAAWDPLLAWAANDLAAPLKAGEGIVHIQQDAAVLKSLAKRVAAMSAFQLAAFHDLVGMSGSLIIGFGVVQQFMPAARLWQCSRIDEDWQISQWGEDDEAAATAGAKKSAFLHADKFYNMAK